MQHSSTIELMHAETTQDLTSTGWMNIRFRHALPPLEEDGSAEPQVTVDGAQVEASGTREVLDIREQLSTAGKRAGR